MIKVKIVMVQTYSKIQHCMQKEFWKYIKMEKVRWECQQFLPIIEITFRLCTFRNLVALADYRACESEWSAPPPKNFRDLNWKRGGCERIWGKGAEPDSLVLFQQSNMNSFLKLLGRSREDTMAPLETFLMPLQCTLMLKAKSKLMIITCF